MSQRREEKGALIKILYRGYLQAILQQERIEGARFPWARVPGGRTQSQCDVWAAVHWRVAGWRGAGRGTGEDPPAGSENINKRKGNGAVAPTGDNAASVSVTFPRAKAPPRTAKDRLQLLYG